MCNKCTNYIAKYNQFTTNHPSLNKTKICCCEAYMQIEKDFLVLSMQIFIITKTIQNYISSSSNNIPYDCPLGWSDLPLSCDFWNWTHCCLSGVRISLYAYNYKNHQIFIQKMTKTLKNNFVLKAMQKLSNFFKGKQLLGFYNILYLVTTSTSTLEWSPKQVLTMAQVA